jgi:hypothetical protein
VLKTKTKAIFNLKQLRVNSPQTCAENKQFLMLIQRCVNENGIFEND